MSGCSTAIRTCREPSPLIFSRQHNRPFLQWCISPRSLAKVQRATTCPAGIRSPIFSEMIWMISLAGPQIRSLPQRASGSGVLVSEDGYIVTNNHVIDEAEEIKVTLSNKKTYTAKLIGTDPSSDLAMLKIEAKGLPFILYGNSDQVKVGQWVLAVGYPLNLETTVTAGIVSAKGEISRIEFPEEHFAH